MNKPQKLFEQHCRKIIDKYVPILLLQRHKITLKKTDCGFMESSFRYPYLNPEIRYSDKALNEWKRTNDMTEAVVHEMCHFITDPLYAKAVSRFASKEEVEDEREQLTDLLSNIVVKLTS